MNTYLNFLALRFRNFVILISILYLFGIFTWPVYAGDSISGRWFMRYPGVSSVAVEDGEIDIIDNGGKIVFSSKLCNDVEKGHQMRRWTGTFKNGALNVRASCEARNYLGGKTNTEIFEYRIEATMRSNSQISGILYEESHERGGPVWKDMKVVEFVRMGN